MSTIKLLLPFILAVFCMQDSFSQIQNIWIGGHPGRETDWNCNKNWSKYKVPDEFNNVVIPDTRSTTFVYPVIEKGNFTINSLEMHPGTKLYIKQKANLLILDDTQSMAEENHIHQNTGIIILKEPGSTNYVPNSLGNELVRRE